MTVRITKPKINVREALNNTDNISFLDLEQRGVKIGESGSETESVLTLNNTDNMFPALVIKGSNSGSTTGYKNDAIEAERPDGYKEQNVGVGPWIVMDNDSNGLADGYPKTAGIVFKANNAESDYHLAGGYDYAYMMFKRTNSPGNNAAQIEFGTQIGTTDFPASTRMTITGQETAIKGGVKYNNRVIERVGGSTGGGGPTVTYSIFTRGNNSAQASGTIEVHAIYGTPSATGMWVYKISGNKTISLSYSDTTGWTQNTPSVYWDNNTLKITQGNTSVYYNVTVRLQNVHNYDWDPIWGDLPGLTD